MLTLFFFGIWVDSLEPITLTQWLDGNQKIILEQSLSSAGQSVSKHVFGKEPLLVLKKIFSTHKQLQSETEKGYQKVLPPFHWFTKKRDCSIKVP